MLEDAACVWYAMDADGQAVSLRRQLPSHSSAPPPPAAGPPLPTAMARVSVALGADGPSAGSLQRLLQIESALELQQPSSLTIQVEAAGRSYRGRLNVAALAHVR